MNIAGRKVVICNMFGLSSSNVMSSAHLSTKQCLCLGKTLLVIMSFSLVLYLVSSWITKTAHLGDDITLDGFPLDLIDDETHEDQMVNNSKMSDNFDPQGPSNNGEDSEFDSGIRVKISTVDDDVTDDEDYVESPPEGRVSDEMKSSTIIKQISPSTNDDDNDSVTGTDGSVDTAKTVLLWTPRLKSPDWGWGEGSAYFQDCEYSNCRSTSDKTRMAEADVLLFYYKEPPNFPVERYSHQVYVHISKEPPYPLVPQYDVYSDQINATLGYRKTANIYSPYLVIKNKVGETTYQHYTSKYPASTRPRNVVWVAGHCDTFSHREQYVEELQKYIDVDIYGKCGNLTCERRLNGNLNVYYECFKKFENMYKYYLSFENNICEDYFSEKLLNPLRFDLIPVVLGGADYKRDLPPKSVIDVRDFGSPKELAEYLLALSNDEMRYNEYLQWKQHYAVEGVDVHCDLCKFLHTGSYARNEMISPQYKTNYTQWFLDSCDNNLVDRMRVTGGW